MPLGRSGEPGKDDEDFEGYPSWTRNGALCCLQRLPRKSEATCGGHLPEEDSLPARQQVSAVSRMGIQRSGLIEGVSLSGDIDGIGDEIVTTFADPSLGKWWMEMRQRWQLAAYFFSPWFILGV